MKATIKIEYTAETYDLVTCVLETLQQAVGRYDAKLQGDNTNEIRVVKGKPLFEDEEMTKKTKEDHS